MLTLCFMAMMLLAGNTGSLAEGEKPGPPAIVTVETRDFKVEVAGEQAWTIHRIFFMGEVVADATGFYGTVFSPQGGKWIGTGHTEGGVERVQSVTLEVDGKPCELTDGAVYHGSRTKLLKKSLLGPIALEAAYIVTDDCILERHQYEATEEVKVGVLYAFMHCWLARTTEWIAEKTDGTLIEGKFNNSGDFKPREDVKWTALYDPDSHKAMLAWYPKPLAGQGLKTAYWDKTNYHKLYNQIYAQATLPKGTRFEAVVVVRGIEAAPESWKEAVKRAAEETKVRCERGEVRF